jgi:hypothetical protein
MQHDQRITQLGLAFTIICFAFHLGNSLYAKSVRQMVRDLCCRSKLVGYGGIDGRTVVPIVAAVEKVPIGMSGEELAGKFGQFMARKMQKKLA